MSLLHPLATSTWNEEEYAAMQRVMQSGHFTMGKQVALFEKQFSTYIGSQFTVMVNSGSSANLLMVAALFFTQKDALKAGDEVIVPAVSWSTTYFPLHQYGLKLRFVDIDLETLNFDTEKLALAINDKTRLIMAVNLLGNPNDFKRIQQLITGKNIKLIEDNCESMGAEYNNKKTGTFGVMGSFSTFFSHHISTMEGGLITTDDDELYHILLSLRSHGWTRHLPKKNKVCGTKTDDQFNESFRFVLPGYNVRPMELSGAIGIEQIKKLPNLIANRRKNAAIFTSKIIDNPHVHIQKEIGKSSWFGFSLVVKKESPLTRAELINKLNQSGFECRPIVAGNFARNEVMKHLDTVIQSPLTNADHIHDNGLFIGNHHYPVTYAIEKLETLLQ